MKKILFITNIPAPYRVDFFNELGKYVGLTVLFEAKSANNQKIHFNWNLDTVKNFKAVFLSEGDCYEKQVNWSILPFLKRNHFNEIIITNYANFTEMAALLYLKVHHIPYYMETDGGRIKADENRIKKAFKKFLISGATGYFSPSAGADDYLAYYGADRAKIHRYPFTSLKQSDLLKRALTQEEKQYWKSKLGVPEQKMVLGVGQFIYRKGWDILMQVAADLPEQVGIYLVGGKATQEYLYLKKKLHLEHVHFADFQTKEGTAAYYKAADLFVLPTREDIWGLVINEAMGYGLPVITTDQCVAGLALVENGKNGYIVPVGDTRQIAGHIRDILGHPEIQSAMSEESLRRIQPYTIENMTKVHAHV